MGVGPGVRLELGLGLGPGVSLWPGVGLELGLGRRFPPPARPVSTSAKTCAAEKRSS